MIIVDKIIDLLANGFGLAKEWVGYRSKELDQKNTEPMKVAAQAQAERDAIAKTGDAIAKRDAGEMEKELAE